ncbi:annexin A13-like [Haemaphysalis longicornis]
MVTLLYPMGEFLARELHAAMKGTHTDVDCLVEILCTRSNKDIYSIKESYAKGDTLEPANRQEGGSPDPAKAKNDALTLELAGVNTWSTDGSLFNQILASQSYEQLRLVFQEYNNITGRPVVQAIESEMTGNVRTAYLAIAKCLANIPYFFAEKLDSALKAEGVESCDKALVRIIVSRCEVDLAQIKDVYAKTFNMTLQDAIRRDKSGDYRDSLLILVQGKLSRPRSRSDDSMDLEPHIKSELRGRFEELVVTLLCPMEEFLARELRAAIKGAGADEEVLVEILCTRSNKDIRGIKESYAKG